MRGLMAALLVLGSASLAHAQQPPVVPDFAGFGWGVGFSWTNSLTQDIVRPEDIQIVGPDRILEVQKVSNTSYGMVFESHITFQVRPQLAIGPYFSVTPGDEQLVRAVGLGVLFELNRPRFNAATRRMEPSPVSFNLGVGVNVHLNVTLLRRGLKDGFHVPETVSNPLVERERATLQVMSVVGF
jgi:hypothetical protein